MDSPYLKFRLLRNVTTDIGDGMMYHPPISTKFVYSEDIGYERIRTEFDMSKVHTFPLPENLVLRLPKRRPEWNDAIWGRIYEECVAQLIRARGEATHIRKKLQHHVANGTIEVVEDPTGFMSDDDVVTSVEDAFATSTLAETAPKPKAVTR
jgi:hypothetical protein